MKKSLSHKRKTARTSQSRSRQRRLVFEMLEDRKVMTAPVLDPSASPVMDATEGKLGANYSQVYSLVDGSITDPDGAPVNAIAIIGVKNSLGTLQYQLPSTTDWLTINADLLNSQTNELALLLGQGSKLRFFPFGNLNGSIPDGITFRAWDRSSGSEGQYTVITSTGGNTAFSTASDTVEIRVRGVNEAPSFAPPQGTGTQIVPVGNGDDDGRSMVVQPDGRILIAGTSSSGDSNQSDDFSVTRLNPNGSLDTSFGIGGKRIVPVGTARDSQYSLALQADGRILVAGISFNGNYYDMGLIRLNSDGSLDTSFDSDGKVIIPMVSDPPVSEGMLTVQPDGKIVVAGSSNSGNTNFTLIRLNADGSMDRGFNSGAKVVVDVGPSIDIATSVTVQSDGRILVAGYSSNLNGYSDFSLIRLNANGSLDTSFGVEGKRLFDFGRLENERAKSVMVQPDGKIFVAGTTNMGGNQSRFGLVRLDSNGDFDPTFGDGTWAFDDFGGALGQTATLQPDGRILIAGYAYNVDSGNNDFAVIRLNADGSLDASFDKDGKLLVPVGDGNDYGNSIAVQPDGRIVVAGTCEANGSTDFCMIRLNADGTLDRTINDPVTSTLGGTATFTQNGSPVVLDHDVRIFDPEMSLSNFNGSTLTLFRNGGAKAEDNFSSTGSLATLNQGGNLVVSGTTFGTVTTNSGGTLVLTFNTNATNSLVNAAMQQIAYANTETNPPDAVQIRWIFRDGDTENQSFGTPLIAMDQSTVAIHLINNAPVLDASKNPSLGSMLEGATNSSGVKVSDMIVNGSITDADGTAVKAIAVTGVNTSLGTMQYSLDNGNNWSTINSAAINSQTDELALLLGPAAKLRFIPFGNLNGSLSDAITFRAWDQRSGKQGDYTVITRTGGSTAFSAASDTADLTVTAVNSAPSFAPIQGAAMNFVSFGGISDEARSVSVRSDGRILVGGVTTSVSNDGANFSFSAARFNVDGSLDTSFDGDGKVIVTSEGLGDATRGMAVQPDERIVMVGVSRPDYNAAYGLVRWNSDGSLDTSFDSDGKVSASINFAYDFAASVVLQPDGKILASGTSLDDFSVLRLNPNGSLDTSYGIDGKMTVNWMGSSEQAFASTLQSDGRLLIAGVSRIGNNSDFSVVRLNTDGTLDTSFDRDGKLSISMGSDNDIARSIVLQSDGRIILAGSCTNGGKNNFALVRLNTDGSLDTSFGNGGKLIVPVGSGDSEAYGVNVQPDGKIVVVGRSSVSGNWDASILRLNADGTLDTNFADAGKRILPLGTGNDLASSVSVQPDGRIVIAGNAGGDNSTSRYCVIRLNSEGSLDTTFNGSTSNTLGGSVSTLENIPIVLDQDVQIFDADLSRTNFAGAKLTLTRDGGSNPEDLFSATGSLGALTQGGNLVVDGKTIGTVTTNSSGTLVLTFNTSATNALVNSAMQQITYSNSSDTPPSNVTIVWTFSDGNSGSQGSGAPLTAVGSVTVNIIPVNDPPVATPDSYRMRSGSTKLLDVLANDYDTDGPIYGLQFVEFNFPPVFASATKFDGKVRFQINDPTFEGKLSFRYVAFDYQLSSNIVEVSIDISDFPYQNPSNPFNVDNDSSVSPLDVLAIINLLNSKGPAIFVDDLSGVTDYVDVNGDNRVDPLDVLAVINHINTGGNNRMGGEGEGGELAGEGWPMPPLRDSYSGTPMVNIPGIERSSEAESRKSPARMLRSEAEPIRGNFSVLNPGLAERVFEREQWNIEQPEPEWDDSVRDTDLIDLAFQKLIPRSECVKWAL